jgi:predicted PurR-regulated permease PerM
MPDQADYNSTRVTNDDIFKKVPARKVYSYWAKIGFFFALGAVGLIAAAIFGVKFISSVLSIITPFAIALVIALLLDPLVDRMQNKGIHRVLAVAIVFVVILGAIITAFIFAVPNLISQATTLANNIPVYISGNEHNINLFLKQHPKIGPFKMPKNWDVLAAQISTQFSNFVVRSAGGLATALLVSVSTIIDVIITLIAGFYLLIDIDRLRARFFFLAPSRYRKKLEEIGKDIGKVFSDYLRGLVVVCSLYGLTTQVAIYGLAFMPKYGNIAMIQYALLLGVSAGVLYAIPYLGSFTIGIVTFLVAFSAGGFRFGVIALFMTLVVNQTFDNVVAPKIIGGGNGLNPLFVIFALSLGGALLGIWGLLLAVPVAASIQVIVCRLWPRLAEPTPPSFLIQHGVPPAKGATTQVLGSEESKEEQREVSKLPDTV